MLAFIRVHLVLHPHGIISTFLKLDSWSSGAGFYSYYIHQGNKSNKEMETVRKKLYYMHTKRFNTFFKRWVQFHVHYLLEYSILKALHISYYQNNFTFVGFEYMRVFLGEFILPTFLVNTSSQIVPGT